MKLDHIQLAMPAGRDEDARRFFRDILGMDEESKPEPLNSRGGCWFRKDDVIVHIGVDDDFAPQRKAHPAFCVRHLEELADHLRGNGLDVMWDDSLPSRKRFYSTDPFGNRIEFLEDGDGFLQK